MFKDMLGEAVRGLVRVPSEGLGTLIDLFGKMKNEPERWIPDTKQFIRGEIQPVESVVDSAEKIRRWAERKLRRKLGRSFGKVPSLPAICLPEFLAECQRFNTRPVYLPEMEISSSGIKIAGRGLQLKNWVLPRSWFDEYIEAKKIKAESRQVKAGWRLADFSVGVDYTNGTQVFPNDPLSPLITRLRQEGRVGKHDKTPLGSRFSITPPEWDKVVCPEFAKEIGSQMEIVHLESYAEFNAIGNLYDPNRGKFVMWEWFVDTFEDSDRLCGGNHRSGGLASVSCHSASNRSVDFAGRPLVSFVK